MCVTRHVNILYVKRKEKEKKKIVLESGGRFSSYPDLLPRSTAGGEQLEAGWGNVNETRDGVARSVLKL